MLIIPAIDLRNGRCVRLTQGRKRDVKVYDGDPVEIALRFEAEGARFLHVVDLDGAFDESESTNRGVVRQIVSAVKIAVEFGGGMRSVQDVKRMIENGVERVVIGTLAVESPESLLQLVKLFSSRIAVGVDARDGEVVISLVPQRQGVGGRARLLPEQDPDRALERHQLEHRAEPEPERQRPELPHRGRRHRRLQRLGGGHD